MVMDWVKTAKRESDLLITSMITDWNGRQEVLLPINHNHYNFRKIKSEIWKIAFNCNFSFIVSTICEKIDMEQSFKNGITKVTNSSILE